MGLGWFLLPSACHRYLCCLQEKGYSVLLQVPTPPPLRRVIMRLWAVRFLRGLWGCGGISVCVLCGVALTPLAWRYNASCGGAISEGSVGLWLRFCGTPLDRHAATSVMTHLSVHLKVLCEWSLAALSILAEGAIALSVTLSGGALWFTAVRSGSLRFTPVHSGSLRFTPGSLRVHSFNSF